MDAPTLDTLGRIAAVLISVVILIRTEPAINRMSRCTPLPLRLGFVLMAGGALAQLLAVLSGYPADLPWLLISAGVAGLLLSDRRRHEPTDKGIHHA